MFLSLFLIPFCSNRVRIHANTMADVAAAPKAKKAAKAKKPATHPKYSEMIAAAIKALKSRTGCSRAAILKYITANYSVGTNPTAVNSHLKLALKSGLKGGSLKQTKGTGASGSFKLSDTAKKAAPKKAKKPKAAKPKKAKPAKKAAKKPAAKKAAKKPAAKKAKTPKKAAAKPKKAAAKPKKPKTPKKAAAKPKKKTPKKASK